MEESIYGEKINKVYKTDPIPMPITGNPKNSEEFEPIIFIDCDKPFTLMDQIMSVRTFVKMVNPEIPIVLYVVKGTVDKNNFAWFKLWQYLREQDRLFSIVFRGVFPEGAETVSTYGDKVKVYLSKDITYHCPPYDKIQVLFKERGYNFTEI